MDESEKSARILTIQFLSKVLMVIGGLVFLYGDRFLGNVMHVDFLTGEVIGIHSGLLLGASGFKIGKSAGVKGR